MRGTQGHASRRVGRPYNTTILQPFQRTMKNILTLHIVPQGHGGGYYMYIYITLQYITLHYITFTFTFTFTLHACTHLIYTYIHTLRTYIQYIHMLHTLPGPTYVHTRQLLNTKFGNHASSSLKLISPYPPPHGTPPLATHSTALGLPNRN